MTKKTKLKDVKYQTHEHDPGDKRTQHYFKVVFTTDHGDLVYEEMGHDEWNITLAGLIWDLPSPDFGVPDYYSGKTAIARFEKSFPEEATQIAVGWLKEEDQ